MTRTFFIKIFIETNLQSMNILISNHALKRIQQRKKFKDHKIKKDVENAWYRGVGFHNATEVGVEVLERFNEKIPRIYDNFIYLFVEEDNEIVLVTILYLDKELRNKIKKKEKKQSKGYINRKI